MKKLLCFSCGQMSSSAAWMRRLRDLECDVEEVALYSLDHRTLDGMAAVFVGMHVDQRFLASRSEALDGFIRAGGSAVVGGHVAYPFITGLTPVQSLGGGRIDDLTIARAVWHPVWDGVAPEHLTFRRGVAGFYGRAWHQPPDGAIVIHTIGPAQRPLDFIYRLGAGRILFHGGNDLWSFGGEGDTTRRILPQLAAWLLQEPQP